MSSQLNASLLRLKLLDALRSGDTAKVKDIIEELNSIKATIQTTYIVQLRETVLHYAVQVAQLPVIQYMVHNADHFGIDINAQDQKGNTPLHLAAATARIEVVKYLLSLPNINDTIVNKDKKQPVEVSVDLNVAQLMQFERAKFVEKLATQLRHYFTERDYPNLENLLVHNPRGSELLDINGADPETGNTVLHEFIRKNDVEMVDWILKHGGDPFKRDKRGKLPIDLVPPKNDPLKRLIKLASKDQNIMDPVINTNNAIKLGTSPAYKGYLRKWTNFASGYKLRYFVLDQFGVLSYYANQDETDNACRGSLNLGYATLHLDSSEKLKFEIIGKNGMRWHLKANHPIETNRWVWTLQNAITVSRDSMKKSSQTSNAEKTSNVPGSPDSVEGKKRHLLIPGRRKHKRNVSLASAASENEDTISVNSTALSRSNSLKKTNTGIQSPQLDDSETGRFSTSRASDTVSIDNENFDHDIEYGDSDVDSEAGSPLGEESLNGPLADQVTTAKNSLQVEISGLLDLFASVSQGHVPVAEPDADIFQTSYRAINVIQDLFTKYVSLVAKRDLKYSYKLERQQEVNTLWESSIRQLENEIRSREDKIADFEDKKKQLRKYLQTPYGNITPNATGDLGPAGVIGLAGAASQDDRKPLTSDPVLEEFFNDNSDDEFFDADDLQSEEEPESSPGLGIRQESPASSKTAKDQVLASPPQGPNVTLTGADDASEITKTEETEGEKGAPEEPPSGKPDVAAAAGVGAAAGLGAGAAGAGAAGASGSSGASGASSVSGASRTSGTTSDVDNQAQEEAYEVIDKEGSYLGYENPPRKKLAMDEDNRPKLGLWSILKSMIGKDMTRMTLPVSFNEPTSLLQRLAEDIEYSNLLDKAATFDDSTLRLLHVSAFACSEYSSTIERIAKPFNPLLGETFEYSRPDKGYRLLAEQVSHHPPISACRAEHAKWDYFGENAVDSKFKGPSFDIKHLGRMFCTVRPDHGVINAQGERVSEELYTWKKVNTAVVGIMYGSPSVDNYGKMEVKNTTTGDVMVVDMKPRGWKASSAYHLSGQALDSKGKPRWAMRGKWDSKIFAKKITEKGGDVMEGKLSNDPLSGDKFLLWQVSPKPGVPFNLTAFATTLNGIDDNLKPWLAPTDTRLRPDQRAMEEGRYDEAADEKHRIEVKQRVARKNREETRTKYKPNWFIKKQHPATGDDYWEYNGEYWKRRQNKDLEGTGDIF